MRKSALLAAVAGLATAGTATAQVLTFGPGPGGLIPDSPIVPPGTFSSTITVPAGTGNIVSFNNVTINMHPGTGAQPAGHSWVGDLVVTITAPNGDNAHVIARTGSLTPTGFGDDSDFSGGPYVFTETGASFAAAAASVAGTVPVPAGTYARFTNPLTAPNPPLDPDTYAVFAGDNVSGTWTLTITDWAGGDTGSLANWSFNVTVPEPASVGVLVMGAGLPLLRRRRK